MKVTVRLYGTWRQRFPGYQPSQGIEVEIPEGATVEELLDLLRVSETQGAVVMAEGRILKSSDLVRPGVPVSLMQTIGGG